MLILRLGPEEKGNICVFITTSVKNGPRVKDNYFKEIVIQLATSTVKSKEPASYQFGEQQKDIALYLFVMKLKVLQLWVLRQNLSKVSHVLGKDWKKSLCLTT